MIYGADIGCVTRNLVFFVGPGQKSQSLFSCNAGGSNKGLSITAYMDHVRTNLLLN